MKRPEIPSRAGVAILAAGAALLYVFGRLPATRGILRMAFCFLVVVYLLGLVLLLRRRWNTGSRAPATLDLLNGVEFEAWVAEQLSAGGFVCQLLPASHDFGIDVVARRNGVSFGIQCKRYASAVGNGAVQQAVAGAMHHGCSRPVVVTQARFTAAAREQARRCGVVLIGRDEIGMLTRRLLDVVER